MTNDRTPPAGRASRSGRALGAIPHSARRLALHRFRELDGSPGPVAATRPGPRPRPRSARRRRPTRGASPSAGPPPRAGARRPRPRARARRPRSRARRDLVDEAPAQRLVGGDLLRGQEQVLRDARPQSVTRRAGPTGTPSAAPGKRSRRFEPPTRMSQATAISAPPPTHVAVAGGDGRLREAGQLVVEVGEELHAADPAVGVELLADVGAGREAHVVGRGDDQRPDASSSARSPGAPSISSSIWVLIALRASGRSRRSTATPCSSTS